MASETEKLAKVFGVLSKDINTSIPGHVIAFDPLTQLAQIQIGVVGVKADDSTFNPQPLIEVPVQFSGNNDFILEHEINPNDEGIVFFSQRCIDGWVNTGGIAENPIIRFHDRNDAYFVSGLRSQVNKITDFKNDGVRMRNKAGTSYIWLKKDGTAEIKVTSLKVDGDLECTKTVTGATDVVGGGISVKDHTHQYYDTPVGNAETLTPTAAE